MVVGGQRHTLATLPPERPGTRRLGGPQGRSGRVQKISPPQGFNPWSDQPVASRYTDWAILAHDRYLLLWSKSMDWSCYQQVRNTPYAQYFQKKIFQAVLP